MKKKDCIGHCLKLRKLSRKKITLPISRFIKMNFTYLKKIFINLTLFVVSLSVFLILIEGVLVFFAGKGEDNYGFTKEFQEKHVKYNKHGYRDYEYQLEKPEGVFRILVLGDSQTFGHGIKDLKDTWVKRLEAKMNKKGNGSKIEVLSVSGQGWNTDTQLYELFKHGFNFNPDLVILAYYHNDIPVPTIFDCDSADLKIIPDIFAINNSKLIGLVNFRINRLLESTGKKPSYSDCLNQNYSSVGWEMEKFYLDTMGLALFIKKIHFMITIIPLIHQLDDEYPLAGPHQKLKDFAGKRNIEFLDLYEEGFKNLDASELKISKTDHHLNQRAGGIVADVLFERLQNLTNYKSLVHFHKAYSLKEILNINPFLEELDRRFNGSDPNTNIILNSEKQVLQVIGDSKKLILKKFQKASNSEHPVSMVETTLNSSNELFRFQNIGFYPNSKTPQTRETIIKNPDGYTQTTEAIKPIPNGGFMAVQLGERTYQFDFEGEENRKSIKLEKDIFLPDPKVIDKWIFQNTYRPSENYSRAQQKKLLLGMITKNPNIYNSPDDLKLINQTDFLNNLSDEALSQKLDERILFQTFLIYGRYKAQDYVSLLLELIEQHKPSSTAINAGNRYRLYIQQVNNRRLPKKTN